MIQAVVRTVRSSRQSISAGDCARAAFEVLQTHYGKLLQPPIDIEYLAGQMGFQVLRICSVGDEWSGLVSPKHKLIGVNGNHHRHRQRFTIAHELGHISLHHPSERTCTVKEIAACNREADVFASELLIPADLLFAYRTKFRYEATLARLFDVSDEAMSLKIGLNATQSNPKAVVT